MDIAALRSPSRRVPSGDVIVKLPFRIHEGTPRESMKQRSMGNPVAHKPGGQNGIRWVGCAGVGSNWSLLSPPTCHSAGRLSLSSLGEDG